eukprot:symbB.v1.2.022455.t1/scaffold1937.1/size95563/4
MESYSGEEFVNTIMSHKHLKARNPVLVSEVRRQANGRWEEVSKGFVLPPKWRMDAPTELPGKLKSEASITRLQRAMELLLQAEGIEAFLQVENLETAAEATERRSAEAQKRRALELWMPPKAKQPLPITGLVEVLEVRWASTNEEELCDTRAALLFHLADTPNVTQTLIHTLWDLFQQC